MIESQTPSITKVLKIESFGPSLKDTTLLHNVFVSYVHQNNVHKSLIGSGNV